MGVIVSVLSKVKFDTSKIGYLEIELNEGPVIHLQNEFFRIEMNPDEFTQFASNVINGANKLIESKNLDAED
jgi:hypothetical protein